jgi:hypothetical protein
LYNERLITMREAEDGTYSIDDLIEATEACDAWQEARYLANRKVNEK